MAASLNPTRGLRKQIVVDGATVVRLLPLLPQKQRAIVTIILIVLTYCLSKEDICGILRIG
jgi:hypothetical protein